MENVTERLDVVEDNGRTLQAGERRVRIVADVEIVERSVAGDAHHGPGGGLHEMHLQVGRERASGKLDRQFGWDVAHVRGEVEVIDAKPDRRFRLRREGQGASADFDGTAIDDHPEQRLDENPGVSRQVRDKGQVEIQMLDGVLFAQDLVVEAHVAVTNTDIGKRKALRFARRRGRSFRNQQIGEIKLLIAGAHEMKCGPVNSQFLDHGREPKERGPRELDAQMAQVHEGHLRIAIGDMQLVELETQAIRIESDAADGHRATDGGSDLGGEYVTEDHRHAEEAKEAEEHHDHDEGGGDAARPFSVEESGRAV
jgi:hypothetical protein